ncbi:hypothetical protein VB738_03100 [Cyanobium gracile UHCC 0139]|uniref:Uncharacterized protein n=1 Tax=Cyanobium gracile UHCC 0139 TaxID=3110308 RepID=A0ABU5RR37_9CYAN|nr:hypothetical protein [Cyanobium gracile]MEA5390242.1 hypothetical protein [Cyanobium gracile UHCC 0139]
MAETSANDAAQRYAVIEQAYSREKWATVLGDGEALLKQLRPSDNPQLTGLKLRLQLLLGHTQLYGYGDKAAAAGYYGSVAELSSEAALTRIAEQGLKQCAIDAAAAGPTMGDAAAKTMAPAPGFLSEGAASPAFPGPVTAQSVAGPAAPWLTTTSAAAAPAGDLEPAPSKDGPSATSSAAPAAPWSEPSLIPEVVEEPELIELHQADPALADDVELSWQESTRTAAAPMDKEDEELLSGLMLVRVR